MSNGIKRDWFVSSYTAEGNSCVQTRVHTDGTVDMRNSVNPDAGTVSFPGQAWSEFVSGVRADEFNLA